MKRKNPLISENVDRDPRLFMWFLTLVLGIMYALALFHRPELRQSWQFIVFTTLMVVHVFLHWQIEKIIYFKKITYLYLFVQGILGFVISWMTGTEAIIFAVFMALLGEVVGMLGLSRTSLIASTYYLALAYINLRNIMDEGSSTWMLVGVIPVIIFVVTYVTLYRRQTDARERAQTLAEELEKANQQLNQYAARVEDLTITNERQRMARELHDTLSQGLTGIILQLEAIDVHLTNGGIEKAQSIVNHAMQQARATLSDARNAIDDLRSESPESLETAIRLEVARFESATDTNCDLKIDTLPTISDSTKEVAIQNVAEALSNVARHALASLVVLQIIGDDKQILVTIQDDGVGFDPSTIPAGHYGLLGIQERMHMLGGEYSLQSRTGNGTRIEMRFPV